jgi:hypothetical protein
MNCPFYIFTADIPQTLSILTSSLTSFHSKPFGPFPIISYMAQLQNSLIPQALNIGFTFFLVAIPQLQHKARLAHKLLPKSLNLCFELLALLLTEDTSGD